MRCTKLNFEDFYSARAFSTLQEAAKQRNGVLRDTDYSVPVFQGCVCIKHQPHGSVFWERRNGQRVQHNPKNIPGWKMWGDGTWVCFGEAALEDSSLLLLPCSTGQEMQCQEQNQLTALGSVTETQGGETGASSPLLWAHTKVQDSLVSFCHLRKRKLLKRAYMT